LRREEKTAVLGPVVLNERPMRDLARCEAVAKAYNENVNLRAMWFYYCVAR
jgi:hypothetical protein